MFGESGVGKSTLINSAAIYLKHNTLEEAAKTKELEVIIPSTNKGSCDDTFQKGQHDEHVIETEDSSLHFIEIAGLDDTGEITKILDNSTIYLQKLQGTKAFCFLMEPNISRLKPSFRTYMTALLNCVDKQFIPNIYFCFTRCRGTNYRPGDTLMPLETLLTELKININLDNETCFCFDNESFRYLASRAHGKKYTQEERQSFSESWKHSSYETKRLIDQVKKTARTLKMLPGKNNYRTS